MNFGDVKIIPKIDERKWDYFGLFLWVINIFMNKSIFEILLHWPRPYISGVDLLLRLDKSRNSRYGIIKRAIKEGYIIPIKKDLFLIKNTNNTTLDLFQIAPIIYGPSYISFESALSYHGWIPEAVRTTTCATVKRSRKFETPLGIYSYEHIPVKTFQFGIEQHVSLHGVVSFISSPIKALADLIYTRKRFWPTVEDLSEDLRIELVCLEKSDRTLIEDLIKSYPSSRVKKMLQMIQKSLR